MTSKKPEPPQPPNTKHKISFYRHQIIGMAVIILIPVLALFGLFGETRGKIKASSDDFSIEVEYPERFRYKTIQALDITVENTSEVSQIATVTIDKDYISRFSNVTFSPQPKNVTDKAYIFEVGPISPRDKEVIAGEVQAEQYGRFEGVVGAGLGTTTTSTVTLTTISLP